MNWINVNDALPEHERDVLAWSNKTFYVANFSQITRRFYCSFDNDRIDNVTHWCEITPPQENHD